MSAHQERLSTAPAGSVSLNGSARPAAIGRLADLVGSVVTQLEAPSDGEPLQVVVAECNAVLEGCLEAQRDGRDREDRETNPREDLKRLARLLTVADRSDVVFVMRQIRRVLGRFDACGA